MYELFWEAGTVAMPPHIALEEVGVPYKLRHVDMESDAQRDASFLALNPAGELPVLVHGDVVMTEAAAITHYIAARHPEAGLLPDPKTSAFGQTLRWLGFAVASLQTAGRRMFYPERFSADPSHADAIQQCARRQLLERWQVLDEHALKTGPFILGDRYSIADIYLVFLTHWYEEPDELLQRFPNVLRMHKAAIQRPATKRILDLHNAT